MWLKPSVRSPLQAERSTVTPIQTSPFGSCTLHRFLFPVCALRRLCTFKRVQRDWQAGCLLLLARRCVHYQPCCLSDKIGHAGPHSYCLDRTWWMVHAGRSLQCFIISSVRGEALLEKNAVSAAEHGQTKGKWNKNESIWRPYFQPSQVQNILVAEAAAVFIVPRVGDVVAQII